MNNLTQESASKSMEMRKENDKKMQRRMSIFLSECLSSSSLKQEDLLFNWTLSHSKDIQRDMNTKTNNNDDADKKERRDIQSNIVMERPRQGYEAAVTLQFLFLNQQGDSSLFKSLRNTGIQAKFFQEKRTLLLFFPRFSTRIAMPLLLFSGKNTP